MPGQPPAPTRRAQTVETILDRALEIMAEAGVGGVTMTQLARAMGIQPPSLYKYFASVLEVHDALFARGQRANLEALRRGMRGAEPGLPALVAGLTACAKWAVANPVLAQLLFWRPVPGFTPSATAWAPAAELVDDLQSAIRVAVAAGELRADADSDEAMAVLGALHFGVISQHLANDPGRTWRTGRYTRVYDSVINMFVSTYRAP